MAIISVLMMSNGIREMKKFIKKVHKMKRINDSAYLGLLVTGYSVFSETGCLEI
jgi:glycerol-3-phosphate dehydrogenase (NAD(P)+)